MPNLVDGPGKMPNLVDGPGKMPNLVDGPGKKNKKGKISISESIHVCCNLVVHHLRVTPTKAPPRTHTTSMMSPTLTSTGPMCSCVVEGCCLVGGADSRWTMGGPSRALLRTDACLLTPEQWRHL